MNTQTRTLRTFREDGAEINRPISRHYEVVKRDCNYKTFCKVFKDVFGQNHVVDTGNEACSKTHGFILDIELGSTIPFRSKDKAYIINDDGSTFSCITF